MPRGHLASKGTGEAGATKGGSPNWPGGSWGGFWVCLSNSETLLPARRKSCHRHPQRAIKSDFPSRCRLVPPLGFSPLCKHTHTLTRQGGLKIVFGWPLGRSQAIREVKARLSLALNLGRWHEARTHATAKLPFGWLYLFFFFFAVIYESRAPGFTCKPNFKLQLWESHSLAGPACSLPTLEIPTGN